jgi:hypothetical protein
MGNKGHTRIRTKLEQTVTVKAIEHIENKFQCNTDYCTNYKLISDVLFFSVAYLRVKLVSNVIYISELYI